MIGAAVASEWVKLRRRSSLWLVLAALALTALATALSFSGAGTASNGPGTTLTIAELEGSSGIVAGLAQASSFLGLLVLGLFAYSFAGEFSLGAVRNLLVRQPSRLKLLLGKWLGLSAFAVAIAVLATVATAAVALLTGPGQGIDTSAWSIGPVLAAAGESALALVGFGTLGAILGLFLRSPVVAVIVGAIYVLPLEAALTSAWPTGKSWLPASLLNAVVEGGDGSIGLGPAVLRATAIIGLLALGAAIVFQRRDLTD